MRTKVVALALGHWPSAFGLRLRLRAIRCRPGCGRQALSARRQASSVRRYCVARAPRLVLAAAACPLGHRGLQPRRPRRAPAHAPGGPVRRRPRSGTPPAGTCTPVSGPDIAPLPGPLGLPLYRAYDFPVLQERAPYDLIVYQLGNAACHRFKWPYLLRWPGLVVLHDAALHHARAQALLADKRADDYRAEFRFNHPGIDPRVADFVVAGLEGSPYYLWPMLRLVMSRARAVAVHSEPLREALAEEFPDTPLAAISMGVPDPWEGGEQPDTGYRVPGSAGDAERRTPNAERPRMNHESRVPNPDMPATRPKPNVQGRGGAGRIWRDHAREADPADSPGAGRHPGRSATRPAAAGRRNRRALRAVAGRRRDRHPRPHRGDRLRGRRPAGCRTAGSRRVPVPALADGPGDVGVLAALPGRRQADHRPRPAEHRRRADAGSATLAAQARPCGRRSRLPAARPCHAPSPSPSSWPTRKRCSGRRCAAWSPTRLCARRWEPCAGVVERTSHRRPHAPRLPRQRWTGPRRYRSPPGPPTRRLTSIRSPRRWRAICLRPFGVDVDILGIAGSRIAGSRIGTGPDARCSC